MTDLMHTLLTLTLTGSALAIALALIGRAAKNRLPKAAIYYLWLLVLLRLCLPWAVFGAGVDLPQPVPPQQIQVTLPPDIDPEGVQIIQGDPIPTPEDMDKYAVAAGAVSQPWYTAAWRWVCDNFLWLWLAGATVHLLWFAASYLTYRRTLADSAEPLPEHEQAFLTDLNGGRAIRAFRSPAAQTPMVLGLLRPTIVLPRVELNTRQLEHILRHELTHVRRCDLWFKWLAVLVTSLHWFNPLMPWLRREISRWCELSCDEQVVRTLRPEDQEAYGRTLLALAASHALPRAVPATTLVEEKSRLKERLGAILTFKQATGAVLALCCALAVVFTGCAGVLGVADHWDKRVFDDPGYQGPEWVALSEDFKTVLSAEELQTAVALIDRWQTQNLPDLPDRKLFLHQDSIDLGNYVEFSNDQLYLDVRSGEIGPCTGPVERNDDCGYAVLYGREGERVTDLYLFYLTYGGKMADPEEALDHALGELERAGSACADFPVSRYSWWMVDGSPIHARLYAHEGTFLQKVLYNGGEGILCYWSGDEAKEADANLPAQYVPGLTRAIVEWQKEHAPTNAHSYQLVYNTADRSKYFLSSPQDYAEFLGVAQYSLSTGQMTVLEAPTEADAPYGMITLLYPAQQPTWLYVIGDPPQEASQQGPQEEPQAKALPFDANGDGIVQVGEFPLPTGEQMGLTDDHALLYTAVAREKTLQLRQNVGPDDTMLMLPTLRVLGSYSGENNTTHYVCGYGEQHYYDLGMGLADPRNPKYASLGGLGSIAKATMTADGTLVDFQETEDGADNTRRITEMCGPLADLAKQLNSGEPTAAPSMPKGDELLQIYLNACLG